MTEYQISTEDVKKLKIDGTEGTHYPLHITIEDFVLYVKDVREAGDFVLRLESPSGSASYTSKQLLASLPPGLGRDIIKAVGILRQMYPDSHWSHQEGA